MMVTARVLIRFDPSIGLEESVLGVTVEVPTWLGPATVEFPRLEVVDGEARLVAPAAGVVGEAALPRTWLFGDDSRGWGWITRRSPPYHGEVEAAVASIEVPETVDKDDASRTARHAACGWRDRFVAWTSLIAGQAVHALMPPIPPDVTVVGAGAVAWFENSGEFVGEPESRVELLVVSRQEPSELNGYLLDRQLFDRVARHAADPEAQFPTALQLLRSARTAIRRSESRLAIVEAATAAEICLWARFERVMQRAATDAERSTWTLGRLVKEVLAEGDPMREQFAALVVGPRNDALHRASAPDHETVRAAYVLVRQLVSDELEEPLPVPDNV